MVAIALGHETILAGYAVQFVTATTLVAPLAKARAERRFDERPSSLAKPRLLIVDELGHLPLEPDAAHLFLQLGAGFVGPALDRRPMNCLITFSDRL